ncbi:MAG: hypothetical protein NTU44_07920 [Bacteroidetes bacterium]|nr:hypothetical protein [Bacteroidota bacterium]
MMRKFAGLIILAFSSLWLQAQEKQVVLVEEFTNTGCAPCLVQDPLFDNLLSQNAEGLVTIKYYTSWPENDPFYRVNPTDVNTRVRFYQVTGVPYARINGRQVEGPNYSCAPANLTQSVLDQAFTRNSPFSVRLSHRKSTGNDTLFVRMVVKALQTVKGTVVVQIGVMEKEVAAHSSDVDQPLSVNSNVMRKMLPDAGGTRLPAGLQAGDSVVISQTWLIKGFEDKNLVCVAGWIQAKK